MTRTCLLALSLVHSFFNPNHNSKQIDFQPNRWMQFFNSLEKQSTYKFHPSLVLLLFFKTQITPSLIPVTYYYQFIKIQIFFTFIHFCYFSQTFSSETIMSYHIDALDSLNGYLKPKKKIQKKILTREWKFKTYIIPINKNLIS